MLVVKWCMKQHTKTTLFILFLGTAIITSCSKDDDLPSQDMIENNSPNDTTGTPPVDTTGTTPSDTTAIPDTTTAIKETVDTVVISRYAGLWYEIATIPQVFQAGCNCTTAEYAATSNPNEISVTNKCNLFSSNGFVNNIEGSATIVSGSGNAKLLVSFFGFGGADYWIIDLDEDYQWAVVGSPDKQTFWILSRTRTIDQSLYQILLQKWGVRGYDISKVKLTNQNGC